MSEQTRKAVLIAVVAVVFVALVCVVAIQGTRLKAEKQAKTAAEQTLDDTRQQLAQAHEELKKHAEAAAQRDAVTARFVDKVEETERRHRDVLRDLENVDDDCDAFLNQPIPDELRRIIMQITTPNCGD